MSNGRKRTKVVLNKEIALVRELNIEDMIIINRSGKRDYLNRLRYLNVPTLRQIARGGEILANRDNIVRDIYNILFPLPDSHSKQAYFQGVIYYFRYLDEIKYEKDSFDNEIMRRCIQHYNRLRNNGQQKSKSLSIKTSLSFFLRQWNREADLKCLPLVSMPSESKVLPFHTETELKPLAKVLVKGALAFQRAIEGKIFLDIHPFYDEKEFSIIAKKNDWSPHQVAYKKNGFKNCMRLMSSTIKPSPLSIHQLNKQVFYNHASRNWFFVISMLTGMNKSVLANIRFKDVMYRNIGSGRFIFKGEKFRADYKGIDNICGFNKRTRELIDGWLRASKVMYEMLSIKIVKDLPIFPYFNSSGEVLTFDYYGSDIGSINKQLEKVTGLRINTRRFRATKSDVLMRVTEDIFLVSQGLNNTVNVVSRRYASGVKADHDSNLNATFSALDAVARGEDISKAIENAKATYSDILSDFEYKKLLSNRNKPKPFMTTPTGVKCSGPTPDRLAAEARRMMNLGVDFSEDTGRCTDFLGCFECESHKLVASENDIWLMLSFLEQLEDLKEIVATNSTPRKEYFVVEGVLKRVLDRMRNKAPKNYKAAKCKVERAEYHPLYQDRISAFQFF